MIAVPKLVLIVLVALAVWYALRWFNRMAPNAVRRGPSPWTRSASREQPPRAVEDLVSCRACGAYVAASARSCGRAGCPRPA
ncbi:MAG: hypothetical protein JO162_07495 [Alphaproteobacteria bacterium]|nr:hypothetical protein [Alphaproteobacteria bacterium]MBV9154405.1 hypothetical protein [Alphaproteobacteria bacterium]MBV9584599.1 hypothetical protein [Alphaproteobacteria bacterium]